MSYEQIVQVVTRDIRKGMNCRAAMTYLQSNRVEHSYVARERLIMAAVRRIRGTWFLVEKDAGIPIHCDAAHRVTRVEVRPVYTSF